MPCAWLSLLIYPLGHVLGEVPPPQATPVEIIVSGRTSTLKEIRIAPVGEEIPRTYAGDRMRNTPGFSWYVSRHYALKAEVAENEARHYLEVAELAYPHWVQIIGREPPGIDTTRMCLVYARDLNSLQKAVGTDLGTFWAGSGGGVTLPHNRTAYHYPSGGLKYHKRDLIIHENLHALQFCAAATRMPHRFVEGIAHAGANHVYDEEKKQLTVSVFDKATINNPIGSGLMNLSKDFCTIRDFIEKDAGEVALYTQFYWTDPGRLMKWRLWRDELFRLKSWEDLKANDMRLMQEIFQPLEDLEKEWKSWVGARHHSFHFVEWGWEQSGNTLWSYGWPWDKEAYSQTNLRYTPAETASWDFLRMDYPAEPMLWIVGPVQRGLPEPSVGCVVDFSRAPGKGRAGLGLGVEEKSHCPVTIHGGREITIGGYTFPVPASSFPIPPEIQEAARQSGHRFGLTVHLRTDRLEVTVRAGPEQATKEMKVSVPITEEQRERMMKRHVALISKDSWHGLTPYIDDRRRLPPDLSKAAPANRWCFSGLEALYALYKAAYHLGEDAPETLLGLRDRVLAAVDKDPVDQARAMEEHAKQLPEVFRQIRSCRARAERREEALIDLSGLWMNLELADETLPGHLQFTAYLGGLISGTARGHLEFTVAPQEALAAAPPSEAIEVSTGKQLAVRRVYRHAGLPGPLKILVRARVVWQGQAMELSTSRSCLTSLSKWMVLGPLDNPGGHSGDVQHPVLVRAPDLQGLDQGAGGSRLAWKFVERKPEESLTSEFLVDFIGLYGQKENAAAYASTRLLSQKGRDAFLLLGSDDGVIVWLNGQEIHKNLVGRGYESGQDRIRIRLEAGTNELMVKVTQGVGAWKFCAHLVDEQGEAMDSVVAQP